MFLKFYLFYFNCVCYYRLCYVASQDGHMLSSLSFVNVHRLTPAPAVVMQGVISLIFILVGDIVELIEMASFLIWIFYGMAMVSLLILRKTMKDVHRPYRVNILNSLTALFLYNLK